MRGRKGDAMATAANKGMREARIAALRRFNRFYTQRIGVLQEGLLDSPFSLAQVRVLYELARPPSAGAGSPTATELSARLGVDEGYLSRIVHGFESNGMLRRRPSAADARRQSPDAPSRITQLRKAFDETVRQVDGSSEQGADQHRAECPHPDPNSGPGELTSLTILSRLDIPFALFSLHGEGHAVGADDDRSEAVRP